MDGVEGVVDIKRDAPRHLAEARAVERHHGARYADQRALSCTRFLWTPICPRRDRNDGVQNDEDRSPFCC
jgi:hypothetical protein